MRSTSVLPVLLGLIAGCASRPLPAQVARALVTIDERGGHCPRGECRSRTSILADGTVMRDSVRVAMLDRGQVARLVRRIEATDFAAVRAVRPSVSPPFAGCQSAADGVDVTYHIDTPAGVEDVDGCTTAIDFHAPLFELIGALVASPSAAPDSN